MTVAINPGGHGCNTAAHQVWEPNQGGCSDIKYQKTTALVVSVSTESSWIESGSGVAQLQALVITENGNPAPAGVVVKWSTSNGNLGAPQTLTDAAGMTENVLSGATAGASTVTASAEKGGATVTMEVRSSKPVIASFTEVGKSDNWGSSAHKYFVANRIYFVGNVYEPAVFSWGAEGADRYVLIDPFGRSIYSGTATSVNLNNKIVDPVGGHYDPGTIIMSKPYILRAYKGTEYSQKTLQIRAVWNTEETVTN